MLHRILAVRHAKLLVQVADMRLNGRRGNSQLTGNLLVAVARINQTENLPFTLGQRAGTDQLRDVRVGEQAFNEPFIKVGEFVAVMLVNLAQNTLRTMLFKFR